MTVGGEYRQLSAVLLGELPELRAEQAERLEREGRHLSPHVAFGDVLFGSLLPRLERPGHAEDDSLDRAFQLLERMASSHDGDLVTVVSTTVCARRGDERRWPTRARRYMGPRTLALSHETEKFYGRNL